ncbi:MAG: GNAT family N-acetyltransferase [Chloroflexota bacterium]
MDSAPEIYPVTPQRWDDLQTLFGPNGACAGCWCMYWRVRRPQYEQHSGEQNRQALQQLIQSGAVHALLAYLPGADGRPAPAGWVSLGPRADFPTLNASRNLAPIDDLPVWSVVCFYTGRAYRRRGLNLALLTAAVDYARDHGAQILEGYPVQPKIAKPSPQQLFTGLFDTFLQAGFEEAARRKPERPIMRKRL